MRKEDLEKIQQQIENVLESANIDIEQFIEFKKKLVVRQKEKEKEVFVTKIVERLFKQLVPLFREYDQRKVIDAIRNVKIEPIIRPTKVTVNPPKVMVSPPKIVVNPAKVVVKAQEFKVGGFFKKLLEILKTKPEVILPKKTIPVELTFEGEKYRAVFGGGGPSKVWLKDKNNKVISPVSAAENITVYNVAINLANTEYSQALPAGTKKFKIYAVDVNKQYPHGDTLKYTTVSGESSGTPISIPPAGYDLVEGVDLTGTTLYFQTPSGSPYVVIVAYT